MVIVFHSYVAVYQRVNVTAVNTKEGDLMILGIFDPPSPSISIHIQLDPLGLC